MMGPHEYRFINLFRALAAFWVLSAHCMIWGGWYGVPLPSAKIAVDLFMLVSGFLMAANAVARWNREPLTDPRARYRFWTRRFFRIAPAYYLALAVAIALAPMLADGKGYLQSLNPHAWRGSIYAIPPSFTADNVLMHVSFLFGLNPDYAATTGLPDWSLSLEMQFYLAFPLLLLWLRTPARILIAGIAIYGAGLLADAYFVFPEPSFLPLKLNYFLAGMLLYQALQPGGARCIAAALPLAALGFGYGAEQWVPPALLLAMFALGSMEHEQRTPAWMAVIVNAAPIRFASDVSYSVYLFHGTMIGLFGCLLRQFADIPASTRTAALFAFVIVTSYAVAWASYRFVELPGIAIGRRIGKRKSVAIAG